MKGALVVSENSNLRSVIWQMIVDRGGRVSTSAAQWENENHQLFTVWADEKPFLHEGAPTKIEGTGEVPNLAQVAACWIECRWEDLFIEWIHLIAQTLKTSVWVLDGNGVLWESGHLEASSLQL